MNTLADTGFGPIRMDFHWSSIESKLGVYDFSGTGYDWLTYNLTQSFDMTPYYILDYGNDLYSPDGSSPITESAINGFTTWAVNSTTRYKGKNIVWELWNEPNGNFWLPVVNVSQYVALGVAAGAAIKNANPSEVFVGPATAGFDQAYIQSCFDGGMLNYWDAVSVHFYRGTSPDTATADFVTLRKMIRLAKPDEKVHVGILSGEWGYTTADNPADGRMVTEEQQAQYIAREYLSNLAHDVPISIWYDFHDDGTNNTNSEHRFGVTRYDYNGSATQAYLYKPSGQAAKNFFNLMRGLRFNKLIPVADPAVNVAIFNDGGDDSNMVVAFWTPNNDSSFQLPVSSGTSFTLYNMYGNITSSVKSSSSSLTLTSTQSPQYLVLNGADEVLTVLAHINRLPIDTPACILNAAIPVTVPNPLSRPLTVTIGSFPSVQVMPGQSAFASVPAANPNSQASVPITIPVTIEGIASLTLFTNLVCDAAITVSLSFMGQTVIFELANPSAAAFTGKFNFQGSSRPVAIPQGDTSFNVSFPISGINATNGALVTYSLVDSSGNIWVSQSQNVQLSVDISTAPAGPLPSSLILISGGNGTVPYNATATVTSFDGIDCFELSYRFYPGWKYLEVNPKQQSTLLHSLQYVGMWVYGDNSHNALRVLFLDNTTQALQYTYGEINWLGWKYVGLNITTSPVGFWDGANDGIPHFPLRWGSYFLLDSTQIGNSGTVYITAPTVVL